MFQSAPTAYQPTRSASTNATNISMTRSVVRYLGAGVAGTVIVVPGGKVNDAALGALAIL